MLLVVQFCLIAVASHGSESVYLLSLSKSPNQSHLGSDICREQELKKELKDSDL